MRNEYAQGRRDSGWKIAAIAVLGWIAAVGLPMPAVADGSPVVLDEVLNLVCFPPAAMQAPPCPVPVGIDPALVAPDPSGELRIKVRADDTAKLSIRLDGMSPSQVVTAFFVHFPPNTPPPHPIFAPIGPGLPPVAHMDSPVAHTRARFADGLGREPNQIRIRPNGKGRLFLNLDYNPLKVAQVPLVNGSSLVTQGLAPAGSGAEQSTCCMDFPAGPQLEPIGASYLRKFDPVTGFQVLGADGRPELIRSPTRPVALAIFVHIDGVTSGRVPGIPTPPFLVNPPVTTGSFYLLGIFFLGPFGMP